MGVDMKVHELLTLLQKCDPDGDVQFSLPLDVIERTAGNEGVSLIYVPVAEILWSTRAHYSDGLADRVTFSIPELDSLS